MLHLCIVQQTYPLLANCEVLMDILQIVVVQTAKSFSLLVLVERRITVDLMAALGPNQPTIPTDKMLESS